MIKRRPENVWFNASDSSYLLDPRFGNAVPLRNSGRADPALPCNAGDHAATLDDLVEGRITHADHLAKLSKRMQAPLSGSPGMVGTNTKCMVLPLERRLAIGRRIAEARNKTGLSQADFAPKIGASVGLVGHYETGRSVPPHPRMERIAVATGVSVEWLLTGDDPDELVRAQTVNEREMLREIRKLPKSQQEAALAMIRGLTGAITKS